MEQLPVLICRETIDQLPIFVCSRPLKNKLEVGHYEVINNGKEKIHIKDESEDEIILRHSKIRPRILKQFTKTERQTLNHRNIMIKTPITFKQRRRVLSYLYTKSNKKDLKDDMRIILEIINKEGLQTKSTCQFSKLFIHAAHNWHYLNRRQKNKICKRLLYINNEFDEEYSLGFHDFLLSGWILGEKVI